MLVDCRGWAFDHSAQQIASQLADEFYFDIKYVHDDPPPELKARRYDLLYVFFWGERFHHRFNFSPARTIKEVSSHRWQDDPRFGPCTPKEMVESYLTDAETLLCTSKRLREIVKPFQSRSFHTPNGINVNDFKRLRAREGPVSFGWAGNIQDPVKGVNDILMPACEGEFELLMASGGLSHREMNTFYNRLDVLAIASRHEGEPLTLVEGMAAGCFPVCCDVGIVPELIEDGKNGIIVSERTPEAFRRAFQWCSEHPNIVRAAGIENARRTREERNWARTAQYYKIAFEDTLDHAARIRNGTL
jgi:glycosyltransferase involved in cell wall biosynthesis